MDYQQADAVDALITGTAINSTIDTGTNAFLSIADAFGWGHVRYNAGLESAPGAQSIGNSIAQHPLLWLGGAALIVWAFK